MREIVYRVGILDIVDGEIVGDCFFANQDFGCIYEEIVRSLYGDKANFVPLCTEDFAER